MYVYSVILVNDEVGNIWWQWKTVVDLEVKDRTFGGARGKNWPKELQATQPLSNGNTGQLITSKQQTEGPEPCGSLRPL